MELNPGGCQMGRSESDTQSNGRRKVEQRLQQRIQMARRTLVRQAGVPDRKSADDGRTPMHNRKLNPKAGADGRWRTAEWQKGAFGSA
jgi:hypothetical protein